jgi:hypothetical protein
LKQIGDSALFVTAITDATCITVSGRPDYLATFSASLSTSAIVHKTSLDTLYHASVLTESVRDRVLSDITTRRIKFPALSDIRVPIRSTLSGDTITRDTALGAETLAELVVDMIISQSIDWISVVEKSVATVPEDTSVKLLNCGPGTGLTKGIDRAFSRSNVSSLDLSKMDFSRNEASSQHEPIAIIGMAVNMPGALNHEKLWEVLETGINTIAEVRFVLLLYPIKLTYTAIDSGTSFQGSRLQFRQAPTNYEGPYR